MERDKNKYKKFLDSPPFDPFQEINPTDLRLRRIPGYPRIPSRVRVIWVRMF